MTISLTNKRNTKIIEEFADPCYTNGRKVVVARKLLHHGSNTCTIVTQLDGRIDVDIDLCGWDTVTTRGKINKFLATYLPFVASVYRDKGKTYVKSFAQGSADVISLEYNDRAHFSRR